MAALIRVLLYLLEHVRKGLILDMFSSWKKPQYNPDNFYIFRKLANYIFVDFRRTRINLKTIYIRGEEVTEAEGSRRLGVHLCPFSCRLDFTCL